MFSCSKKYFFVGIGKIHRVSCTHTRIGFTRLLVGVIFPFSPYNSAMFNYADYAAAGSDRFGFPARRQRDDPRHSVGVDHRQCVGHDGPADRDDTRWNDPRGRSRRHESRSPTRARRDPRSKTPEPSTVSKRVLTDMLVPLIVRFNEEGLCPLDPKHVAACKGADLELPLTDEMCTPFSATQRRSLPEERRMFRAEVQKLVDRGVIRRSVSPWATQCR